MVFFFFNGFWWVSGGSMEWMFGGFTVAICSGFVEDFWRVYTGRSGAAWCGLAVGRGFGLQGGSLSLDQSLP